MDKSGPNENGAKGRMKPGAGGSNEVKVPSLSPQKPMSHRVYVSIGSRDHPPRVDSDGLRAVSSARKIERGDGAVLGPDESVSQKVYVKQGTDDCSWRVDAREKSR